jgi:hypothetical protein
VALNNIRFISTPDALAGARADPDQCRGQASRACAQASRTRRRSTFNVPAAFRLPTRTRGANAPACCKLGKHFPVKDAIPFGTGLPSSRRAPCARDAAGQLIRIGRPATDLRRGPWFLTWTCGSSLARKARFEGAPRSPRVLRPTESDAAPNRALR